MKPLYLMTRDQLADIFGNPANPVELRNAARAEFDAKTDAVEGR